MKQVSHICVSFALLLHAFFLARTSIAGTDRDRAVATVAVARAAIEIAAERPQLPDSKSSSPPTPSDRPSPTGTVDSIGQGNTEPPVPQDAVPPGKEAHLNLAGHFGLEPIRIETAKVAMISEVLPAQLVIGGWDRGCSACDRLEREIKTILTPLGWAIGNRSSDQIQFVHLPQSEAVPQITLYQNGEIVKTWDRYIDPGTLSQALRKTWDEAPPLVESSAGTSRIGSAGTIHAQSHIRTVFAFWREHFGQGVNCSVSWDRAGAQTFPLLAKGDWSAIALFGQSGRIELAAPGAKGVPVDQLGFGYRVMGDDFSLDLDPVVIKGLAARLGPSMAAATPVPTPSRFELMTAWTVMTILRDIWSILHPACDLQLGGNISASAVLDGDMLSIDFRQCPSIRLVALFTFQLQVKRIEITESSVKIHFGGSRLVKERTFEVK